GALTQITKSYTVLQEGEPSPSTDMQLVLFDEKNAVRSVAPFSRQLLKWIGNKQRFAHEIVSFFPNEIGRYFEPFIGSGAVLATLSPNDALGFDTFPTLIEIWSMLLHDPATLHS